MTCSVEIYKGKAIVIVGVSTGEEITLFVAPTVVKTARLTVITDIFWWVRVPTCTPFYYEFISDLKSNPQ